MLTDKGLKTLLNKPQIKEVVKSHRYGVSARVRVTGAISFIYRYRYAGKAKKLTLGVYPQLSLMAAGTLAKTYNELVAEGLDPQIQEKLRKVADSEAVTVRRLADKWYKSTKATKRVSCAAQKGIVERHLLPKLGDLPWDKINKAMWMDLFEGLSAQVGIVNVVLTEVKNMCNYGESREEIENLNVLSITPTKIGYARTKRTRSLSSDELAIMLNHVENGKMNKINKLRVHVTLIFGCRIGELRNAKKVDFDFKEMVWTIHEHKERARNPDAPPIYRPIIDELVPILKLAFALFPSTKYAFPSANGERCGDTMESSVMAALQVSLSRKGTPIDHFTFHDLRRTARTNWSRVTTVVVAEKMLGHKMPFIQDVYDKYSYMDEMREAYTKWYALVEKLRKP
jgi:integrase